MILNSVKASKLSEIIENFLFFFISLVLRPLPNIPDFGYLKTYNYIAVVILTYEAFHLMSNHLFSNTERIDHIEASIAKMKAGIRCVGTCGKWNIGLLLVIISLMEREQSHL